MSRTLKIELPCGRQLNFHVFAVSASNKNFWLNLERLGRFLGGASWSPLGRLLDSTWSILGPTWALLGVSLAHLGRSWGQLGRTLGYMDLPKLLLGYSRRLLGVSWRPQGAVLAVQSGLSNSTWRPKALRGANFGGLELFQMPSWRRVAFPDSSIWRNQAVEEQSS